MAKLTAKERTSIPKRLFGIPEKAPKSGSYPMPDKKHAEVAEGRAKGKPEEKRVREKAHELYPSLNPAKLHSLALMAR